MKNWKENISFILVEPREGGNIGAAARAIHNMGFSRLELVKPKKFPSPETDWFAHGAEEVLKKIKVHQRLASAFEGKKMVIGTTRRTGKKRGPVYPLREGAQKVFREAVSKPIAIIFGREDRGLTNKETAECAFLLNIKLPGEKRPPSVNLAQAVLLTAYEVALSADKEVIPPKPVLPSREELLFFYKRTKEILERLEYREKDRDSILRSTKVFLERAEISLWELNMLHGLISQIEARLR